MRTSHNCSAKTAGGARDDDRAGGSARAAIDVGRARISKTEQRRRVHEGGTDGPKPHLRLFVLASQHGCCLARHTRPARRARRFRRNCRRERGQTRPGARCRNQAATHRRPSPSLAAHLCRRGQRQSCRRSADEELDGRQIARRHGQGGRRDRHAVHHHARRQFHRGRAGTRLVARMQRICRKTHRRPSGPVRQFCHGAAHRHRRRLARDRICSWYAEGRRHRPFDELRRQMARAPLVPARDGRTEPAQGAGLHAPDHGQLLRQPGEPSILR